MNYGKTAYLKVLDLEKKLALDSNSINSSFSSYLELNKQGINQTFSSTLDATIEFPKIDVTTGQNLCFQIKTTIYSLNGGNVNCEILINDLIIHEESKEIASGESDFIIFKTFSPVTSGEMSFTLRFYTNSSQFSATIKNINVVILGAGDSLTSTDIELRAIKTASNNALVSFIDSGKLYYQTFNLTENSLKNNNFTYYGTAKSHSFSLSGFITEQNPSPSVTLYRVDTNGNLYMSKNIDLQTESYICSNVSVVFACPCPNISDDTNIITYIKDNGNCYYRTIRGDSVVAEKQLSLPKGRYVDIRAVSHEDSDYVYIIASHENGSNYILRSLVEVSTGKIVEMLEVDYMITISKYIDLSFAFEKTKEHLTLLLDILATSVFYYDQTFERVSHDKLNLNYNLTNSTYVIVPDITYGVKLDKSILTGTQWASYTDDAVGYEGAYMDFSSGTFVDNGWTDRWPFNSIRPCILKNGEILGYLNPNDYNYYIDGTKADIKSSNAGDVMVEFPKIYFKLSKDDNYIYIQISNKPKEGFTCSPFVYKGQELSKVYVAAYLSCGYDHKTKGYKSKSSTNLDQMSVHNYATSYGYLKQFNGDRFEMLTFNMVTLLGCLFAIMFKSTNSQKSLGYGSARHLGTIFTGNTDTKGMYYGNQSASNIKVFGIEDLYGSLDVFVGGYYVKDFIPRFIDPYDANMSYDINNSSNYLSPTSDFVKPTVVGRSPIDINGINELGFFPAAGSRNYDQGFCDLVSQGNNTAYLTYGLSNPQNYCGIYNMHCRSASYSNYAVNVRPMYFPVEEIGGNSWI